MWFVMITTHQVPKGKNLNPLGATPPPVDSAAVEVKTNVPVTSPVYAAVQAVIVPVAAIHVPVITGCDPVGTGPPL